MEKDIILDEFVEFHIYDATLISSKEKNMKIQVTEEEMCTLYNKVMEVLSPLIQDYIWHEDYFTLSTFIPSAVNSQKVAHLYGKLILGDGLEDEWYVTHMLLSLSKKYPNLVITVEDADGEFLLIEAAEYLPSWLEPETAHNRIFLSNGSPCFISPVLLTTTPTLPTAISFINNNFLKCQANVSIQGCIQEKIKSVLNTPFHRTRVTLPKLITKLFQSYPHCITTIVSSLSNFEPSELARASLLNSVKEEEGGNLELCSFILKLSRLQYAKLLCLQLSPPKYYPIPSTDSPDYLPTLLGAKLSLGIELAILKNKMVPDLSSLQQAKHSISQLLTLVSEKDFQNNQVEEEDGTEWLNVEEGPMLNNLMEKLSGIKLNEFESEQIVEKMLAEEENPQLNSRLLQFMKSTSGLDGIYYDSTSQTEEDDEESESISSSCSSGLEEDEEFLCKEIMEAVMHDPDLLMKMLEKGDALGFDTNDFMKKIKDYKKETPIHTPSSKSQTKQKGIIDIDPLKVQEAKASTRAIARQDYSSSSEEDVNVYEDPEKPSAKTQVFMDEENDDDSIEECMEEMDQELMQKASDRLSEKKAFLEFAQSVDADKSPAHSLLFQLHR